VDKLPVAWSELWSAYRGEHGEERAALNQAQDAISGLNANQAVDRSLITRLFELDRAQGEELAQLRVLVQMLFELVVEKGLASEVELTERLRQVLQARATAQTAASRAAAENQREEDRRNPFQIKTGGR